jgi:SAM-dependent methyltransferase
MTFFVLATFSGAFLLFQVQPLMGKYILPWFGGGPGVWTTCMLFFQVLLLAGYAYAHGLSRLARPGVQAVVHVVLIAAAWMALPITPAEHWKPTTPDAPVGRMLGLLLVSLGLPYFVLSATSPLLQAWFSRVRPGSSPYRLYALSNAGSLLALLSYPLVFEPLLSRQAQADWWGWGLAGFALCAAGCAWQVYRAQPGSARSAGGDATTERGEAAPEFACKVLWFALPGCASVLLLAITNTMCLDVAVVPFLWVLPLSLYLLSFMLCFDSPRWYSRPVFTVALWPAIGMVAWALYDVHRMPLLLQVAVYSVALFVGCMLCHGELYRLKPAPAHLTSFYLWIAGGGAAGGIGVAVIAPLLFRSYAELPWGLWLLSALLVAIHARARTALVLESRRFPGWVLAALGSGLVAGLFGLLAWVGGSETVHASRNFYGVLSVRERYVPEAKLWTRALFHGSTLHGLQLLPPKDPLVPLGYYRQGTGVELALSRFPRQEQRRMGMVGLGIGTLAIYGGPSDVIRFYEINPAVVRLAESRFAFLEGTPAQVEVVLGDARISLENEPPQGFDVLVLDAFSSDAIPVHLLTREAFALYARHLKPDGALLIHITNRHLDLEPVVEGLAAERGLSTLTLTARNPTRPGSPIDAVWMIVSRNEQLLNDPAVLQEARAKEGPARHVLWTDDHSSLLQVLGLRR